MEQYIVFTSHDQLFCLPVTVVRRIVEAENFVPIPDVPAYILGVYEYEEQMLPIIDAAIWDKSEVPVERSP